MLIVLGIVAAVVVFLMFRLAIIGFVLGTFWLIVHGFAPAVLWVLAHPLLTIGSVVGYLLIGAGWSIAKWWFAETNRVRAFKESFARNHGINDALYAEQLQRAKTNVVYHKSDIIAWITFWPLSAVYTLLNDPIRRAARRIYAELQGVYQRITDSVWK